MVSVSSKGVVVISSAFRYPTAFARPELEIEIVHPP